MEAATKSGAEECFEDVAVLTIHVSGCAAVVVGDATAFRGLDALDDVRRFGAKKLVYEFSRDFLRLPFLGDMSSRRHFDVYRLVYAGYTIQRLARKESKSK